MNNSSALLFEKFEVLDTLKKDSHSAVYLAMHTLLGKEIILKTLNTKTIPDETIIERFKREGKLLARLDHPNIIKILDFGTYADTLYISFEYFKGRTLREAMQAGTLDDDTKKSIFRQLLAGLKAAHDEKIIHRDLKPENILLDGRNIVKIADFGLASSELETTVTNKSSVLGTPGYMSPEQIYGEKLTLLSDIFSVGVIGYELFTGNNPFLKSDISATVNAILNFNDNEISFPSGFDEQLKAVITGCMKKTRRERTQSVAEVLSAIGGEPEPLMNVPVTNAPAEKFSSKYVIAGAAVILLAIVVYFVSQKTPQVNTLGEIKKDSLVTAPSNDNTQNSPAETKNTPVLKTEDKKADAENTKEEKKEPEAKSGPALLNVTCSPWAVVYLDNQKIDMTPLRTPVNTVSGKHTLRLENPDYPDYVQQITLVPGELKTVQVNLDNEFSSLDMKVLPWGIVTLNGVSYGETPFKKPLRVLPGKYSLKITNPAFQDYSETITVKKGEIFTRSINLQPKAN